MKVGERYKVRMNEGIMDEFKGKPFTVMGIYRESVLVKLDDADDNEQHEINLDEWDGITQSIESWDGNILKHRFI